jgi:hypothetical protein
LLRQSGEFQQTRPLIVAPICTDIVLLILMSYLHAGS